jgi:ATP-dependent exoDNAse (exonuclease V) beta subunit
MGDLINKNTINDENISLMKDSHQYVLATQPEMEFSSVTTIIGSYFEPFDEVAIATNLCSTHHKYIGIDPKDLIAKWHSVRDHGSKVHDEIETYLKDGIEPAEPKADAALHWLEKYCMKSDIEIFPEVIVYSTELQVAGTIDVLAYDRKNDYYEIIDWKTGKKIEKESFGGKMGIHPITSHLMDCKYNHYAMQLSFYRFLLEEFYDLKVHDQMIAHLGETNCTSYLTPYYNNEISAIVTELIKGN